MGFFCGGLFGGLVAQTDCNIVTNKTVTVGVGLPSCIFLPSCRHITVNIISCTISV